MSHLSVRPTLPTSRDDWKLLGHALRVVLVMPAHAILAAVVAALSLGFFIFSRNLPLLLDVVLFGDLPLDAKLGVLTGMYAGVFTVSEPLTAIVLVTLAVLLGLNLSLFVYYLRTHDLTLRRGSGSVGSIVLGTLGAGCASCGSAVLAGVVSLVGGAGAVSLLPLDGLEFSLLAIPLILVSTYWIAHGLRSEFSGLGDYEE